MLFRKYRSLFHEEGYDVMYSFVSDFLFIMD